MNCDIDGVVSPSVEAAGLMIQIEREEGQLPQIKRIEKMDPVCGIGDVTVLGDELVVERRGGRGVALVVIGDELEGDLLVKGFD